MPILHVILPLQPLIQSDCRRKLADKRKTHTKKLENLSIHYT